MREAALPGRRSSAFYGTATAVAILPFVTAVGVHVFGQSRAQSVEPIDRPALAFDQYMVNLREVPPQPVVGARFGFANRGSRPITITGLQPSCGCLTPRLAKRTWQPGESGELLLPVETAGQKPGPNEYTLTVKYDDPEPREAELVLKVTLPADQVLVRPRALIFYFLGSGSLDREIVVTDLRKRPLSLTAVRSTLEFVSTELLPPPVDRAEANVRRVKVTLSGEIPAGRHQGLIVLTTDDPAYPRLQVPVLVQK